MKIHDLEAFSKGWFVGDFSPTLIKSKDVEVAVKYYRKGDKEASHVHKVATELTAVILGKVRMGEQIVPSGQIVEIDPGEYTDFEALEDSVTVVVKSPSVKEDKFFK